MESDKGILGRSEHYEKLTKASAEGGLPVHAAQLHSSQICTYTELRQQIHHDLRVQHPGWVEQNGESPMCDFYEARLMELVHSDAEGLN